jgi:putative glutamine amidotransferase
MKKKLAVLVNDSADYESYVAFLKLKYDIELVKLSSIAKKETIPEIDLMLFTGGEDVDPAYYNEKPGKRTFYNPSRDNDESKMFRMLNQKIPKLGICRGSQFLTVMSGGKLIQHVENHGIGGTHSITFDYIHNHKMQITSTHHQMMYPFDLSKKEYILCAYATNYLSPIYLNGNDRNIEVPEEFLEPEIVFYPRSNSLAIQGHPESGIMSDDGKMFILNYIDNVLKL